MNLLGLIDEWISPDANLENFYNYVFNVETAIGAGLDVWGRIVNIGRIVDIPAGPYFGFGEAGDRVGFGQGPFYDGEPTTSSYSLTDAVYRQLIFAKAAYNITDGSIPAINAILMNLFPGRGNAYVFDGGQVNGSSRPFGFGEAGDRAPFGWGPFGDFYVPGVVTNMTMTYVFDFVLQPFEIAIVKSGALPKPTGVKASWIYQTGTFNPIDMVTLAGIPMLTLGGARMQVLGV